MSIVRSVYGSTPDGLPIELFTLRSGALQAQIATYGGVVTSLRVPDRAGRHADVVLGYDNLDGYLSDRAYFGALIGRYANRIAQGRFTLSGQTYQLAANDGPNSLHGGRRGFDKVVWQAIEAAEAGAGARLALRYVSPHGEEGYPGTLVVDAVYTLTPNDELRVELNARSDRDTVLNLTQHSYFNLGGGADVLGHLVQIHAASFTPVGAGMIPTGEIRPVAGTPFDFRSPAAIGARLESRDPQVLLGQGYDHNWVIEAAGGGIARHASVYEPVTGRVLEVLSTAPGLQFYSGNLLDGSAIGKHGRCYGRHAGLCLEPQHFPDSPNQPHFPSTVLAAGAAYTSTIVYRFSVR